MQTNNNRLNGGPGHRRLGFTILELMIAVLVVALLTAIALPMYNGAILKAKISVVIGDLIQIDAAIERRRGSGELPATLAELNIDVLLDPWKNPYQYLNIEAGVNKGQVRKDRNLVPLNTDYDLYSMGPDGVSKKPLTAKDSRDDILRAGNGGFIGRAEDF